MLFYLDLFLLMYRTSQTSILNTMSDTNNIEPEADYIDEVQSHMLGLVVSIMSNYHLTFKHVQDRFEYVNQVSDAEEAPVENTPEPKKNLLYVSHRREFRDALSKGIKICANYMDCSSNNCTKFHVKKEHLCPHAGRDNYCDQDDCDKIVIKACRKGARCNDSSCSFRH